MQPGGPYLRDDQVFAESSRPAASCSSETMARIDRGRARRRTANEPRGPELQVVIAQFPEISGPLSNRKHRSRWTGPFLVVQRLLATYWGFAIRLATASKWVKSARLALDSLWRSWTAEHLIMPGIVAFPTLVQDALAQYGDLFANECQRRHFAEYLTGLIVAERKTVLGIHDEFAQTTDQSCLNRFLTEVVWDVQVLNKQRLERLQEDPTTRYSDQGVIPIDNTLIDRDGLLIPDAGWYWDHAEQRHKIAQDYLFVNYVCTSGKHYPLEFRLFRKEEICEALKEPFRNHTALCCELIRRWLGTTASLPVASSRERLGRARVLAGGHFPGAPTSLHQASPGHDRAANRCPQGSDPGPPLPQGPAGTALAQDRGDPRPTEEDGRGARTGAGHLPEGAARATAEAGAPRPEASLLRGRRPLRLRAVPGLLVVRGAAVRTGGLGPQAVQRPGGIGRGNAPGDPGDESRLHHRRVGLRVVAGVGGSERGVADHAGAGQRAVPEVRRGASLGGVIKDRPVVPAGLLAQPESDRAAVAVRPQGVVGLDVLRRLLAIHDCHRSVPGRLADDPQGRDGNAPDAQVSDIWRCATIGRVEYSIGR